MKNPRLTTALASAALGAGLLMGIPTLSSGSDPCTSVARSTGPLSCQPALQGAVDQAAPAPLSPPAVRTAAPQAVRAASATRQASDPATTPPLHGTSPHGQGTVAVVDTNPDPSRPYGDDPTGKPNNEDIVVGRSRGEQGSDGTYHGHITIAALFGNEILGVDTAPGQSRHGPLDAVQTGLLDALCNGSGNQICLKVLTADSSTTDSGSTNHFGVAHATLGGASGIDAGVAESNGNISGDGTCQTSHGDSQVADVKAGGQAVASAAKSSTDSKACRGADPQQTNTSSVVALGGTGVPIPAAGCDNGTPDTVTGIPTLLPIVCNADDTNGSQTSAPYGVRDALDAFVLATTNTAAARAMTAGSESHAVAPAAGGGEQCSDGIDNDGDGLIDAADPDCHSDGNANNPGSYVPSDNSEAGGPQCSDGKDNDGDGLVDAADPGCHTDGNANNAASYDATDDSEANGVTKGSSSGKPQCSDGIDNDGDGLVDAADPGCHSDGNANNAASYDAGDDNEANGNGTEGASSGAQCSDGIDNDGDGLVDAADPGCHSDGNANNAASYVPSDDSEANGGGVAGASASGRLPMTGTDLVTAALIGALLLAVGLVLRRTPRRQRY
jgi:LPXTG-motif cell wall-anchored protein